MQSSLHHKPLTMDGCSSDVFSPLSLAIVRARKKAEKTLGANGAGGIAT
jgi:hypothetical protein